jgi:nicotinamide phosphoribosyltransferase
MTGVDHVVAFGFQAFIKKYLIEYFNENFFNRSKLSVVTEYSRIISATLGVSNPDTKHLEELHDLGYLPVKISALAEGTLTPLRVPMLVIENTNPKFFWLN